MADLETALTFGPRFRFGFCRLLLPFIKFDFQLTFVWFFHLWSLTPLIGHKFYQFWAHSNPACRFGYKISIFRQGGKLTMKIGKCRVKKSISVLKGCVTNYVSA